ncbi:MAG TPA: bifunctional demethylmenaquinone methyltransferase/2-methoxy-6-polyprenyl-1,4-benzoquinol methylase UbiE [Lacunisphaera sp.]|jgi:demethylmenaquinone methyltransferase/2-methoxy-6-polyprenyl-1,4-benzoquinol methylase
MPDPNAVNSMFSRIASRYDTANHVLSIGIDHWWRRHLVRQVHNSYPQAVLDLACGSGDVAFALADALPKGSQVTGMDFCQPMLDEAVRKKASVPRWALIEFQQGDGMALPLANETFDAITISFGLRNMADRHQALTEMRRVLRPGGRLFVLEFSQPYFWFKPIYYAYLKLLLPSIAAVVTGDKSAYEYLGGSIENFPAREKMSGEIRRAGFRTVSVTPLTFGIVALHDAQV